jgi:hypothetical protein
MQPVLQQAENQCRTHVCATGLRGSIGPQRATKEHEVAAIAHNADPQREFDVGTRRAWSAYSQRLQGLNGEAYEDAERESWAELQSELRRLERRRQALNRTAA